MQQASSPESVATRVPEGRYSYYRRCQVFRRNGEQCKAPAENGEQICHGHAGQQATAVRRERERRAVLAEAVAQMRRKGRPEFEAKDLFMDFNGIQVTLAVMAQALIDGRIDCKTAGRLAVGLQMASKLLWMIHRRGTSTTETRRHGEQPRAGKNWAANEDEETRKPLPLIHTDLKKRAKAEEPSLATETRMYEEIQILPQISADERRLNREKASTTKDTRSTPLSQAQGRSGQATEHEGAGEMNPVQLAKNAGNTKRSGIAPAEVIVIRSAERVDIHAERAKGPPGWARAA
jgi:hypothetical protein